MHFSIIIPVHFSVIIYIGIVVEENLNRLLEFKNPYLILAWANIQKSRENTLEQIKMLLHSEDKDEIKVALELLIVGGVPSELLSKLMSFTKENLDDDMKLLLHHILSDFILPEQGRDMSDAFEILKF